VESGGRGSMRRFDYARDLGTSAVLGKRGRVNISPGM
jgi:hypothetical protein